MFSRAPLLFFLALAALPLSAAFSKEDRSVEGEVLVTFRQAVQDERAKSTLRGHSLGFAKNYRGISKRRQRVSGLVRDKNRSTAELIKELKDDPEVEAVEPNYLRHVSEAIPDDADFTKLWALNNTGQSVNSTAGFSGVDVKFLSAWKLARPSTDEVVVAVADTGVDITHPDLAGNIWVNPGEIAGNGIDDDGDGYTDDVHGYDFADDTAVITDSGFHGTHIAGIIAATGQNGAGVIGVDYRAKILPLKISSDGRFMSTSAILDAFDYAILLKERGVNIVAINASYGGSSFTTAERRAVEALRDAGIILCAAAGNEAADNDQTASYPANYTTSNIISVAALDQSGGLASFSNYGAAAVDLAAPGVNIYSTEPLSRATVSSVTVAGTAYAATPVEYSGITKPAGLSGTIYNCGPGNAADFPAGVSGNIALIQRGGLTFAEKTANAMNAGAVAAIVYDNTPSPVDSEDWTLGTAGSWIPVLHVTQASGQAILTGLPAAGSVASWKDPAAAYQFLEGTSMAAPQVAGGAAFAALNFPAETMSERMARILEHVIPIHRNRVTSRRDGLP